MIDNRRLRVECPALASVAARRSTAIGAREKAIGRKNSPAPPGQQQPTIGASMKRTTVATALLLMTALACLPALAAPEVYTLDPAHTSVGFTIRHIVSYIPGHFNTFSGRITLDRENLAASTVTADIETQSIDTGDEKRDTHLRTPQFFDVEKFPKITFVSRSVTVAAKDRLKVAGDLTMKGVTKPVVLDVTILGFAGSKAGFEAKTTINRQHFGVTWNMLLESGRVLGDDVEITILVEANNVAAEKAAAEKAKPDAPAPADPKPAADR
jgi:polyisoprenoid-binding protein YceI